MKLLLQYIIFAVFNVAVESNSRQAYFSVHTIITPIKFRHPLSTQSTWSVFYCDYILKYVKSNLLNKSYLPLKLIRQAIAENWLDSLIYFLWIRNQYHRPIIYNYTTRRVGAMIKASPTTVSHHISILISKGLCERIGANLHLKSNTQLKAQYKFIIPVALDKNKATQRTLLRFAIIKRNLHSQVRKFNQKSDHLQLLKSPNYTLHEYKKLLRLNKKFGGDYKTIENSTIDCLTLSNASFGILCHRSNSTGAKLQTALNKLNLITSSCRTKLVSAERIGKKAFYQMGFEGTHFLSRSGQVFKRLSNGIEIIGKQLVYIQ